MKKLLTRSIRTKRDYQGAISAADRLRQQSAKETESERRLQALLEEIEKFDGDDGFEEDDDISDGVAGFPRRRWSDTDE